MGLKLVTTGEVSVLFVHSEGYRGLPDVERPLFRGQTTDHLSFAMVLPKSGDYYLVVDNRNGHTAREFTLEIEAAAKTRARQLEELNNRLEEVAAKLQKAFIFDSLSIRAARCGEGRPYQAPRTVVICAEEGAALFKATGDKTTAEDTLAFDLMRAIGAIILEDWKYPMAEEETAQDQFATVLMVMFGQGERARRQAEHWAASSATRRLDEADSPWGPTLTAERALAVLRWLEDPGLVLKWQQVMVPHMRTALLEHLARKPTPWTSRDLVERELALRKRAK